MSKILFVVSELYPLIKTGGLADVAYSLPESLVERGHDVRILMPAYRAVLEQFSSFSILGWLVLQGADRQHSVRILEVEHKDIHAKLWLVDCAALYDRLGNPYLHHDGYDWLDNGERYTVLARAAEAVALDYLGVDWSPDVVHAHDWQTGLVPAFLNEHSIRPRTVFTIHNLAYNGYFSSFLFGQLQLPLQWWSSEGVEFFGGFSMLKAGIVYADAVNTVSPTYADEICTRTLGYSLDGLLRSRRYKLSGILNGIDDQVWNPSKDPYLAKRYVKRTVKKGKEVNKKALFEKLGISEAAYQRLALADAPLLGFVGRLVEQKGIDMLIDIVPSILENTEANICIIGSGQFEFEEKLQELAHAYGHRIFVFIGYDEALAHLLEAGADIFLMPSRFEPCGLNQMYSLKYGTPPVVYHTGGLADTVTNATKDNIKAKCANGFVFYELSAEALLNTIIWACTLYQDRSTWLKILGVGMNQNFAWDNSAQQYEQLYYID